MDLFEKIILGEAVPTDPNKRKQNNMQADQNPPDFTTSNGVQKAAENQVDNNENNLSQQQEPSSAQVDQNQGVGMQQDNSEDQEQIPPDGQEDQQEPQAPGMDDGSQQESEPSDELHQMEQEIFADISTDQMNIKVTELKKQFKKLNSVITSSIDKIDRVSRTTYDDSMIEFAVRKLMELKEYSKDYLLKTFNTKTYIENQVELQRIIITFNLITNLFSEIRISRIKRKKAIDKNNKSQRKSLVKNTLVFSRRFEID